MNRYALAQQRYVSSHTKYRVTHRLIASIPVKAHCGCWDQELMSAVNTWYFVREETTLLW